MRPQLMTNWLFLGPKSGCSGSMSLSRCAACFVLKAATRSFFFAASFSSQSAFTSAAISLASLSSLSVINARRPSTWRFSSPGAFAKSFPLSTISVTA